MRALLVDLRQALMHIRPIGFERGRLLPNLDGLAHGFLRNVNLGDCQVCPGGFAVMLQTLLELGDAQHWHWIMRLEFCRDATLVQRVFQLPRFFLGVCETQMHGGIFGKFNGGATILGNRFRPLPIPRPIMSLLDCILKNGFVAWHVLSIGQIVNQATSNQ